MAPVKNSPRIEKPISYFHSEVKPGAKRGLSEPSSSALDLRQP